MKPIYFALAFAALAWTTAPTLAQDTTTGAGTSTETPTGPPTEAGKTSDRTPGNPEPARTPNATSAGEVGTDAAKTPEGTSDRTPEKHETPSKE
jgi:hypothetical protein